MLNTRQPSIAGLARHGAHGQIRGGFRHRAAVMGKRLKAVGYGVKHFFQNRVDHSILLKLFKELVTSNNALTTDEIEGAIALYVLPKHSLIGVGMDLYRAIKAGVYDYRNRRALEEHVDAFFEDTQLSEDAQKKIRRMLKKGKGPDWEQFSNDDANELRTVFTDICMEAGMTVYF
jgi:hypothetical protein